MLHRFPEGNQPFPALGDAILNQMDDVHKVGMTLCSPAIISRLQVIVIGVLVLVATIGIVVLSKRELK